MWTECYGARVSGQEKGHLYVCEEIPRLFSPRKNVSVCEVVMGSACVTLSSAAAGRVILLTKNVGVEVSSCSWGESSVSARSPGLRDCPCALGREHSAFRP